MLAALELPDDGGAQTLELGTITALWGRNDAGKSTTLRRAAAVIADPASQNPGMVVLAATEEVAGELGTRAFEDLVDRSTYRFRFSGRDVEVEVDASIEGLGERLEERDAFALWIRHALAAAGLPAHEREDLAARVAGHRWLAVQTRPGTEFAELWWCVPEDGRVRLVAPAALAVIALPFVLPRPIAAPAPWEAIEHAFAAAVTAAASVAIGHAERETEPAAPEAEVEKRLLRALVNRASDRLPPFVADHYKLDVDLEDGRLRLMAIRAADGLRFEVRNLAEGYHLWVQLAVLLAADRASQVVTDNDGIDSELDPNRYSRLVEQLQVLYAPDEDPDLLYDLLSDPPPDERPLLRRDLDDLVAAGPLVLLVDEPEAHLHPAAQREAARWLQEQLFTAAGQVVLASHAPAFLGMGGPARLTHVTREPDLRVVLRPLDPRDLAVFDPEVAEMGFDRGELLALHRAVLFVEGLTDRAVLEHLLPDRLREVGVHVQPFHGIGTHRRVVEAETLVRVLGPPFHVLVDDLVPERLRSLKGMDRAGLLSHIKIKGVPPEEVFVANVLAVGLEQGRSVEVHAIPVKDVLGLLDDQVVAEVARSRQPRKEPYPGFQAVLARAARRGVHYERVLERCGVEKHAAFFGEVAQSMRARGLRSPDLERVLDEVRASL